MDQLWVELLSELGLSSISGSTPNVGWLGPRRARSQMSDAHRMGMERRRERAAVDRMSLEGQYAKRCSLRDVLVQQRDLVSDWRWLLNGRYALREWELQRCVGVDRIDGGHGEGGQLGLLCCLWG